MTQQNTRTKQLPLPTSKQISLKPQRNVIFPSLIPHLNLYKLINNILASLHIYIHIHFLHLCVYFDLFSVEDRWRVWRLKEEKKLLVQLEVRIVWSLLIMLLVTVLVTPLALRRYISRFKCSRVGIFLFLSLYYFSKL